MSARIGALLPAAAVAVESPGRGPEPPLWPEEERALGRVAPRRRREFAFARACAHAALDRLGAPPAPILPGRSRKPDWPAGVVGSITHCPGYHAAVVAYRAALPALGVDAEIHAALPDGVGRLVMTDAERAGLPGETGVHWDRLVFCAKEAAFKAWFELTGAWLGFDGAVAAIDPAVSAFNVHIVPGRVQPAGAPSRFDGRFAIVDGLILAAAVPAGVRAPRPERTR